MKRTITTTKAPAAIGPYAQAIEFNGLVFTSGQIPINPSTGQLVAGDITAQTKQVLENVQAVLEAAGSGLDKVLKATVFVKNMEDFETINKLYATFFTQNPPARSLVEVARLPKDVLIEIEVVAHV